MPPLEPSRRRWLILVLIFGAILLNYFDRQIVSILKPTLKAEFSMNDVDYARLLNVFMIFYAAMYPVSGWLADRFGARCMVLAGIVGWSVACLGAGLTRSLAHLTFCRGLLGASEPTIFPAQLRVVTIWFPPTLRATANSICVAGSSIGAILAPPLVAWMALTWNWRTAFMVPGALGLLLAVLWWFIYRDPPQGFLPETDETGRPASIAFSWPQLFRTRCLWGILLVRFVSDPVWYFCLFWLPGYLQESSGLSLKQIGWVGWVPFLIADLGAIGSAAWSDRLVRKGIVPLRARKIMLTSAAALAPLCLLPQHMPHPYAILILFGLIGVMCLSWLFSMSVVAAESFPRDNVASVLGIAGGCGAVGGMIFNHFVGQVIGTLGAAKIFLVMATLHPIAAFILWMLIRPERPQPSQLTASS